MADSEFPTFGLSGITDEDRVARGLVGTVIDGRYRLDDLIGQGGFGWVYRARQTSPDRLVAVKVSKRCADASARMGREADHQGSLDHPSIANIIEAGVLDTPGGRRRYVAMELVRGGRRLDAYCREEQLPPKTRGELLLQVCDAVAFAHARKIIHRDLKPANILVKDDGLPKVIDFGIAKALGETDAESRAGGQTSGSEPVDATLTAGPIGTDGYMSPEQANAGPLDARTDVFALGRVLEDVFEASPRLRPGEPLKRLPRWIRPVRDICTHPDPDRRYRDAGELAADLRVRLGRLRFEHGLGRGLAAAGAIAAALGLWLAWPVTRATPTGDGEKNTPRQVMIPQTHHWVDDVSQGMADSNGLLCAWLQASGSVAVASFERPAAAAIRPPGFPGTVGAIELSQTGKSLAATGTDGVVAVWDRLLTAADSRPQLFLPTASDEAGDGRLVVFSPDDTTIFVARGARSIMAWNREAGTAAGFTTLRTAADEPVSVTSLCRTATNDRVLVGCSDGSVRLWGVDLAEPVPFEEAGHARGPVFLAASDRGDWIASIGGDRKLIVYGWSAARPSIQQVPLEAEESHALAFSPDGERLVVAVRHEGKEVDGLLEFSVKPVSESIASYVFESREGQVATISSLCLTASGCLAIVGRSVDDLWLAECWPKPVLPAIGTSLTSGADQERVP